MFEKREELQFSDEKKKVLKKNGLSIGDEEVIEEVERVKAPRDTDSEKDDDADALSKYSPEEQVTIKDLESIQKEFDQLYESYLKSWAELRRKYDKMYEPLYERRKQRLLQQPPGSTKVNSNSNSTTKENNNALKNTKSEEEKQKNYFQNLSQNYQTINGAEEGTPALPRFWLTSMKGSFVLRKMIKEYDEPILSYLQDITWKLLDGEPQDSFELTFYFSDKNPYFTPHILTKKYFLQDENEEFDAPDFAMMYTEATEIMWKPGKDVTKKKKKKMQFNKRTKEKRQVTEVVERESFFNFFKSIEPEDDLNTMDAEEMANFQELMEADYDAGLIIRDKIIPHAIDLYLEQEVDEDDDDDEECEDDDEIDKDDDDSDDE